jgi:hypothetical protein
MKPQFINFCAGPDQFNLPGARVNAIMINHPQYCSTPTQMQATRKLLELARPEFLFMDSGGYQALGAQLTKSRSVQEGAEESDQQSGFRIDPVRVIAAAAELRPTAIMAPDIPVIRTRNHKERESEFRTKLEFNVPFAIETSELRLKCCPDVGLFIPVQCYTLQHFEEFAKATQGIQMTGFSLPIRGMSLLEVALFMLRFHQLGIRNLHLLGVSAFFPMALAAFMGRHYFQWTSLDATTWLNGALRNKYSSPHDLSECRITSRTEIPDDAHMDCVCPFCKGNTFQYLKGLPYMDRLGIIRSHNYWVTEKTANDLFANAGDIPSFREYLLKRTRRWESVEELCSILTLMKDWRNKDLRYLDS